MAVTSAEEFLDNHRLYEGFENSRQTQEFHTIMREFAEMHRKECLEQVKAKARPQKVSGTNGGADFYIVNKDSILNAYSKKNIT